LLHFATPFSEFATNLIFRNSGNKHPASAISASHSLINSRLVSKNCYEFDTFCYAIFRNFYSRGFPESLKIENFPASAQCSNTTILVSKHCYEFATFCYSFFRIFYCLVFPETRKIRNFPAPALCSNNTILILHIYKQYFRRLISINI